MDKIFQNIDEWYMDAEWAAIEQIMNELKSECMDLKFGKRKTEKFFEKYEDTIRDEIYDRNDSNVLRDLLKNTSDIPVRIELHSNYDCINSHWFESNSSYSYEKSYFGDMVDALKLNPAKVKQMLLSHGYKVYGRFPDRTCRNGKEVVCYEDFYTELINSCSSANLLVFIGRIDPIELYRNNFIVNRITIPKGNYCGLFSSLHGGGSILEMKLQRDMTVKLDADEYDCYTLKVDCRKENQGYSIIETYDLSMNYFKNNIKITA